MPSHHLITVGPPQASKRHPSVFPTPMQLVELVQDMSLIEVPLAYGMGAELKPGLGRTDHVLPFQDSARIHSLEGPPGASCMS